MHHGYDIQYDNVWKSIIEKKKSCIHVWKSQYFTYGGKTLKLKMYYSLYVDRNLQ